MLVSSAFGFPFTLVSTFPACKVFAELSSYFILKTALKGLKLTLRRKVDWGSQAPMAGRLQGKPGIKCLIPNPVLRYS